MAHIVIYTLPKTTPKQRLRFNRELYGFNDYSNRGSYRYYRKGILGKDDYEKIARSVLVVKNKLNHVLGHLRNYKAGYKIFKID